MDPDWSHPSFFKITTDISSAAITANSVNREYIELTPPTIDRTPLNYNARFTDRTGNNNLSSTFNNRQENLNGKRNLTHQDIQTPSHFVK